MVVQTSGELLLRLMRLERSRTVDTEWLLHGPTDPAVVLPFRAGQGDVDFGSPVRRARRP